MAGREGDEEMKNAIFSLVIFTAAAIVTSGQSPSAPSRPFVVRSKQQVSDITKEITQKDGNQQSDVFAQAGTQMRVAIFHDEKRVDDLHEVHDGSDDVYYVLEGEATLMLGGSLVEPDRKSVV